MGNKATVYAIIGASNHSLKERQANDFYATDPKAMELLLNEETFDKNIWECACGQGHLSKVLVKHGYDVISTDLYDRGYGKAGIDFLKTDIHFEGDIITNPPYKYALEFVQKALESVGGGYKVAMFLKLTFLEGKARKQFFKENPPHTIYVSSSRINCAKNGVFEGCPTSAVCYAWFIWIKGYKGSPIVKWIN